MLRKGAGKTAPFILGAEAFTRFVSEGSGLGGLDSPR
jgi:hypothetical protein